MKQIIYFSRYFKTISLCSSITFRIKKLLCYMIWYIVEDIMINAEVTSEYIVRHRQWYIYRNEVISIYMDVVLKKESLMNKIKVWLFCFYHHLRIADHVVLALNVLVVPFSVSLNDTSYIYKEQGQNKKKMRHYYMFDIK